MNFHHKNKHSMSDTAFWIWHAVLTFFFGFYLVPTSIAYARFHRSAASVCLLNVLAGWTVVGWFASLIWAFSGNVNRFGEEA